MLTLQFIPYSEIESLGELARVKKLIGISKENRIIVMEGRLRKQEEASLIQETMKEINGNFKGIELLVVNPEKAESDFVKGMKNKLAAFVFGDRQGLTIIGPANLIKEIKKDPDKIQLLTEDAKRKKARRK